MITATQNQTAKGQQCDKMIDLQSTFGASTLPQVFGLQF